MIRKNVEKFTKAIKVICINTRASSKLVKGGLYSAIRIHSVFGKKYIFIKDIGSFPIINFTKQNGDTLDDVPLFDIIKSTSLDLSKNDYTNKLIRCKYSSGKNLKVGEIYYVEEQLIELHGLYKHYYLKLRGLKRKVSAYNFEEISQREQRAIKLRNLSGDKVKTVENTRKFLLYNEKEKMQILLDGLSRSIIDLNKIENYNEINTDIIKTIIKKCKRYDVVEEDIIPFLNGDIKNILNICGIKI